MTNIYILTHKSVSLTPIHNKCKNNKFIIFGDEKSNIDISQNQGYELYLEYSPIVQNGLQFCYGEYSRFLYLYNNLDKINCDNIGFIQYSRWGFVNNYDRNDTNNFINIFNIDFDNILNDNTIMASSWISEYSVFTDWKLNHPIEILNDIIDVLINDCKIDKEIINYFLSLNCKYHFNTFFMTKKLFKEFMNWFNNFLNIYICKYNLSSLSNIKLYVYNYMNTPVINYNSLYNQCRIFGFISEYLLQLWVILKNKEISLDVMSFKHF